jgi:hypothetical protein
MSKKHKANRKKLKLVKTDVPPRNPVQAVPVVPVNAVTIAPTKETSPLQMWARLPFVMMEAWLAPFQRQR